ncbi:MAG: ATP-binding protein [Deltaproteobacteria bacterium]|nr:ATP-binding protein [Deltaproteobacteria bacterium]MBW2070653.1 ATP-binding protein [Deltaproteobacteria bacterium]
MIIAVASGKGGTGKTTVATNLAMSLTVKVQLIDCDVEEPNSHIFLKPQIHESVEVQVPKPLIDLEKCTFCGECARICRFSAIVVVNNNVLTFPELCHGCGGCTKVCPEDAITEKSHPIGLLEHGKCQSLEFVHGRLSVGEAMSPPLIKAARNLAGDHDVVIVDAPPGTSCPVIAAVKGSDFCLLVTEPTPFGLNDLQLAAEVVAELKIPAGVLINRSGSSDQETVDFCRSKKIPVLMTIPEDRRIAEAYSYGRMLIEVLPSYKEQFQELYRHIKKIVGGNGR